MSHFPHQTVVIQQTPGTSGLAIAGLIFSILGWFTCGLMCIPGAFLCLLALFSRGPKGTAIAGLIVGFPGTLFFAFVGLGIIMAFLGIGAAATSAVREVEKAGAEAQTQMQHQTPDVLQTTENPMSESAPNTSPEPPDQVKVDDTLESQPQSQPFSNLPSASTPAELSSAHEQPKLDEPNEAANQPQGAAAIEAAKWRTWTTADGKYKVEAKFVKFAVGTLTLEKKDGATIHVKLDILCSEDQDFVKRRKWTRPGNGK